MTTAAVNRIKRQITSILQSHVSVAPSRTVSLLPVKSLQGKLYEAHVLATICENLVLVEGLFITFIGGTVMTLRQKGGQLDRNYPYFEIWNRVNLFGELFTDVYFATLSYDLRGNPLHKTNGDYHELDIALLRPNQTGYVHHDEIMLAVECKNTSIKKSIIREVLGFRRELSLYSSYPQKSCFSSFPTGQVHANPNSVHMLFCSDSRVGSPFLVQVKSRQLHLIDWFGSVGAGCEAQA